jgi:threonine dehydratase
MQISVDQYFSELQAAAQRISPMRLHTPVLHNDALNQALGCQLFLKAEHHQHTGAFKYRGACNALLQLSPEQRAAGVFTVSSGNHGAALAAAGQQLGIAVRVGVASNASAVKRANMARYGAELITIEPGMAAREAFAAEQQHSGRVFIPPYNHPHIIAGQGTAALELLQAVAPLDLLLAPLGGGGLLAGTAIAARAFGVARVFGVEPELAADGWASLQQGSIQPAMPPLSICDGLLTSLGTHTFTVLQQLVEGVLLVSDAEALAAQQLCYATTGEWIEPSSATVIAAIARYQDQFQGLRVGAIIGGGNVAPPPN